MAKANLLVTLKTPPLASVAAAKGLARTLVDTGAFLFVMPAMEHAPEPTLPDAMNNVGH